MVSKDGIMVNPTKIEAIRDWDRPISPIEVRSFIGISSYYRHFVEAFTIISTPMTRLN